MNKKIYFNCKKKEIHNVSLLKKAKVFIILGIPNIEKIAFSKDKKNSLINFFIFYTKKLFL